MRLLDAGWRVLGALRSLMGSRAATLANHLDARDRFLKPEGWIIPGRGTVWAALICSPRLYDEYSGVWDTEHQFHSKSGRIKACNTLSATSVKAAGLSERYSK
jgi:hypothetical protein